MLTTLLAAARYEFRMQIARRAVWIAAALLAALLLLGAIPHWSARDTTTNEVGVYALLFNILAPVVYGCLLADRLVRDRRLGVVEILDALPARPGARLLGKYTGATTACAVPLLTVWSIALVRFAVTAHDWAVLPLGWGAFAAIELPALLFVAAFALVGPTMLGVPLFLVLFVGYWFWGNLVPSGTMPTLSGTWLSPLGDHARLALFGGGPFADAHSYAGSAQSLGAGIGSIAALVATAAVVLAAALTHQARTRAAR